MKYLVATVLAFVLLVLAGCDQQSQTVAVDLSNSPVQQKCLFVPDKIKFNQLTEIVGDSKIIAYIDVLDEFGSRIKASGIWRFELYSYVPRSAESKGGRIYLSPEIELTEAGVNNSYWQDYLRCYKIDIDLDTAVGNGKTCILEAMCLTAQGRRINDSIELKF